MGQNVPFRFPRKLPGSVFVLSAIQMVTSNRVQHSHPSGDCCPWLGISLPALQTILNSSCLLPSATPPPDLGNAGCVPSGYWEGRLQSRSTLEVSGLSQSFSHSALTPRDPPGFILFCFSTLPMCQVLLGLRCLFWSHSETRQLSWFLGCCATKIPSRASDAIVCVLADLRSQGLEAAPLILQAVIHLTFLSLWRRWRVSTCFSGRHC